MMGDTNTTGYHYVISLSGDWVRVIATSPIDIDVLESMARDLREQRAQRRRQSMIDRLRECASNFTRAQHMDWNYLELMPAPREASVRILPSPLRSRIHRMRDRIDHAQRRRAKRRAFLHALARRTA